LPRAGDTLAALARVARQALDEERRGLLATDRAIATLHDQIARLREAAERERLAACALADGNARLLAYLRRSDARVRGAAAELRRLEHERQNQAARLTARHLELKRLEILLERRAARAHAERMRCEQQMIDELAAIRPQR
jgi:flagellar biosynthesis chaperone FliJ